VRSVLPVIDADSPHGLLIRHFTDWADAKGRAADAALLEELLRLRSTYDELEPTCWPLDSVEHLLLERWPSKGGVEPPDPDVLVETLDAYFRFLRNTGRMASRSGDPRALTKEARRAARRMPEAAEDVGKWSPTKVLLDFGRSIGIDVDDVPDAQTLQARLAEIQDRWNALPTEERRRRMPGPADEPTQHSDSSMSGCDLAMREFGIDDPIVALLLTFADRLPTGELRAPEVVAPLFREAPYMRNMLALAAWVGSGKEVTSTRVLRPALAHTVHDDLGLGAWTRARLHREYPDERFPGVAALGLDAWIEREASRPWSRAAECEPLHRLWCGAIACGVIRVSGKKAVAVDEPERDAEGWVSLGVRSASGLMNLLLETPYLAIPVVHAMLTSYVRGGAAVGKDELLDFFTAWRRSPDELAYYREIGHDGQGWDRSMIEHSLWKLADTGLYVETPEAVTLTDAGDVFVTAWLTNMEHA